MVILSPHEDGMRYRKIAKWLNENGIRTERGKNVSKKLGMNFRT
jgi:hypothetical protein|tara:strand:+ start:222 stop:353 length:132 start_codon:yes stop_codon:yes gene_type:complete